MFTGIIQTVATVHHVHDHDGLRTFLIDFPDHLCEQLTLGASIAIDGVCLTVTEQVATNRVSFDVMYQSLHITTLSTLRAGDRVNAERAARDGAEIGGHPLSGHVDFQATVTHIRHEQENYCIRFHVAQEWLRYVFAKGYIAINGTSLTISDVNKPEGWFEVWLIPETRRMTTFEDKQSGSAVNIEIERGTQVVVDTVRATLEEKLGTLLPMLEALLARQGIDLHELGQPATPIKLPPSHTDDATDTDTKN
jgi:riboflavin synthase